MLSYRITWWQQRQPIGCSNIICQRQATHAQAHELQLALCIVIRQQQHTTIQAISHHAQAHELSISHRAQAHELLMTAATTTGIFISYHATATTMTTICNNERWVSDGEALCASTQHIHIVSRDGDEDDEDDEVKRTCNASNINTTTSQATSNLYAHKPHRHT